MLRLNLAGRKFGRLTVISAAPSRGRRTFWNCRCQCDKTLQVRSDSLQSGNTKSCQCWRDERLSQISRRINRAGAANNHFLHGHTVGRLSPEFKTWMRMKSRCYDPHNEHYCYYGGRGITVCERWRKSFRNFFRDMGPRPEGKTLGRYLDLGNYSKANCAWMDKMEQGAQRRGKNAMLTYRKAHATLSA